MVVYKKMVFVTFEKIQDARTGNILFQYIAAKWISLKWGHTYMPVEEVEYTEDTIVRVDDSNYAEIIQGPPPEKNIVCRGFFQNDALYLSHRQALLEAWSNCDDYWIGVKGRKQSIRDFLQTCQHSIENLSDKDVVLSLRLDDFIQLPCPTSDIVPPEYYVEVLENLPTMDRLFIVCDTIRHDWEHAYLRFFRKWNPILIQKDLMHDCALLRDAPVLLHSNSTLCWFMSFISGLPRKTRYIPKTNFYSSQSLNAIDPEDVVTHVAPLSHHDVYHLDVSNYLMKHIYPLSYSIPDECIVDFDTVARKKTAELAALIPGDSSTYRFGPEDEDAYHEMYQQALFATTRKKGGWDCLRHYEILANGCIPLFQDLVHCPSSTLTSFPKELLEEATQQLLPWNYDNKPLYDSYLKKILEHTRTHCSTSANTQYFFRMLPKEVPRKVLLIRGNCGVNYTREMFWIGMKRYIQSLKGVAVEYPKIDFLYKHHSGEKKNLYGNGFTYAYRLEDDYDFSNEDIEDKVSNHFFDLIVYGKVGPDESWEGSIPHMPLWDRVSKTYGKKEIVFLYGGDECIDLTYPNHYREHILHHAQYGHCFVRELRR